MIDLEHVLNKFIEDNGGADALAELLETEWIKGQWRTNNTGIRKTKKDKSIHMTQEQINLLVEKYPIMTNRELGVLLNRSYITICGAVGYLRRLGVIKIQRLDKEFDRSKTGVVNGKGSYK